MAKAVWESPVDATLVPLKDSEKAWAGVLVVVGAVAVKLTGPLVILTELGQPVTPAGQLMFTVPVKLFTGETVTV